MKKNRDWLACITIFLLIITSVAGILSMNFQHAYEVVNQYGQTVKMYGYGVYAHDTYLQAPISIGSDFVILLMHVPLFIISYRDYWKSGSQVSRLKLISVYAVAFYYATSLAFGLTYNFLFLIYVALFGCSLFGMIYHIACIQLKQVVPITRGLKTFFVLSGIALMVAWLPDVIPTLVDGTLPATIGVYTTCITYVLDMGIISPLCIVCIYLLVKKNPIGMIIQASILKTCMVIGVMMITQTICQVLSGCDIPLPVLITKSISFIILGGFAAYFNHKMYFSMKSNLHKSSI